MKSSITAATIQNEMVGRQRFWRADGLKLSGILPPWKVVIAVRDETP